MFQIFEFDEVTSTNDYLKQYYAQYANGSVILAHKQTMGRGRFLRTWIAGEDLTFSILFQSSHFHQLIAPLAIIKALASFQIEASIKWPNDILVQGKKVSGILVETIYEGQDPMCHIVGIGINLSEKKDLGQKAGYVPIEKEQLLASVLREYEQILQFSTQELLDQYQEVSYLTGRKIVVDDIIWEVLGVEEHGYLKVVHEQTVRLLKSEEITLQAIYKESI